MPTQYFQKAIRGTETRPYIIFKRIKNRGLSARPERIVKSGKNKGEIMPPFPGEQAEDWHCCLVDHRAPNAPYTWATKEWLQDKTSATCFPIGHGNFDKIPQNYPSEWRAQLLALYDAVKGVAESNARVIEQEKMLAAKEAELEARAKALEAKVAAQSAQLAQAAAVAEDAIADRSTDKRSARSESHQPEAQSTHE